MKENVTRMVTLYTDCMHEAVLKELLRSLVVAVAITLVVATSKVVEIAQSNCTS
jgi:hypothetical protein